MEGQKRLTMPSPKTAEQQLIWVYPRSQGTKCPCTGPNMAVLRLSYCCLLWSSLGLGGGKDKPSPCLRKYPRSRWWQNQASQAYSALILLGHPASRETSAPPVILYWPELSISSRRHQALAFREREGRGQCGNHTVFISVPSVSRTGSAQ